MSDGGSEPLPGHGQPGHGQVGDGAKTASFDGFRHEGAPSPWGPGHGMPGNAPGGHGAPPPPGSLPPHFAPHAGHFLQWPPHPAAAPPPGHPGPNFMFASMPLAGGFAGPDGHHWGPPPPNMRLPQGSIPPGFPQPHAGFPPDLSRVPGGFPHAGLPGGPPPAPLGGYGPLGGAAADAMHSRPSLLERAGLVGAPVPPPPGGMPQLSAWPPSGTGTAQQPMTVEELEMRLNAQVGLGGGVSVGGEAGSKAAEEEDAERREEEAQAQRRAQAAKMEERRRKREAEFAGVYPAKNLGQLDAALEARVQNYLEPTEAEKARMRKTYEDVRAIVLKAFPHGRLEVFGSAATPLMVRNSNDIDMTLLMDDLMQLPDDPESDPEDDASTDANPPAPDGQKPGGTSDAPPGGSRVVVVPVGGKSPPGPGRGAAQTDGGPEGATPARKRRPPKRGQRTKAHAKVVEEVAAVIREAGMEGVEAITTSRIPLLKFKHRETRVSCDITINNLLALYNTRMLADYCRIDDRLRRITMIIKHWAKQRAINEAYRGTLSSYCYAVMAIHLLQTQDPPILPCLQDPRRNFPERIVNGYNTGYDEAAVDSLTNFGQQNQMGLGLLLWNFFLYWHVRHDYLSDVVSIRTPGGFVSKEQKGWTKRQGLDRHLICIEDPFNVDHDLGRVVDKDSMKILGKEFRVAVETLRYNGDHPLDTLFFRFAGNKLSREQQKATMGGRRRQGGGEQQQGNGAPVRRVA